jgi:Ti-type conjugative transfer relaxase TraA
MMLKEFKIEKPPNVKINNAKNRKPKTLMAIYHLSAQVISRSQGHSSVAAAAYRSAEKLTDERVGRTFDFTKKNDVLAKEILLPEKAQECMQEREQLWNLVEQKENRKDAQVAREINIALPRELNNEQNWELAKDFVRQEFVSKGMVADLSFHSGHFRDRVKEIDSVNESSNSASNSQDQAKKTNQETKLENQPHIHIMLTMRELTEEGFGQKVREWNSKEELQAWREHWAERCNLELARLGLDVKIDHRSLDAQQINLEPQSKIGPRDAYQSMVRFNEHQELAYRNGERIKDNPEIALDAITRQQSTFTYQDVARFVNRHTKTAEQFTEVYEKVLDSNELVHLGRDDRNIDRYTTKSMFALEKNMLETANAISQKKEHSLKSLENIKDKTAHDKLNALSPEQRQALNHITLERDLSCVIGFAGTGKSHMLGVARDAWESQGYNVTGATLSGIAAENLEAGSNIKSYTIANRLWHWERDRETLTAKDVLVIDEAGMLGSRQMATILEAVQETNAKAVLIGDPEQLQAIEAGAAFRAIAEDVGYVSLTDIRRQLESWQREATKDFAENRTKEGLLAYEEHDNIHKFITKAEAIKNMVEEWDEVRSQSPEKSQIMLAYTKAEVKELNEYARSLCRGHGELGEDFGVKTSRGIRDFATGDRVYFLRNENYNLHVKNGTLGTVKELDGTNFTIKLDSQSSKGQDEVKFKIQDYRDIEHGYAATIHKAQGITVDRSHVLASKYFDKHTAYVAMSRHREGADLYYAKEEFAGFNALARVLGRERAKDVTLDYNKAHNIETKEDKLLEANKAEQESKYNFILTQERERQAELRLTWRAEHKIACQGLNELANATGLELTTKLKEGDRGVLIGQAKINGSNYAVVEQERGQGLVISHDRLGITRVREEVVIERYKDQEGHDRLRGCNPIRQKEYEIYQAEKQHAQEQRQQQDLLKQQREQEKIQEQQQLQQQRELDRGGFER